MNSLETLKQELINQKNALSSKGVEITIANTNPSPSEITAGINSIEHVDFTQATATENDVLSGKTFYAGNSTLKTGVSAINTGMTPQALICAVGDNEIFLPTDENCTAIRDYCFMLNSSFPDSSYYKENLTIPDNIKRIRASCFANANLTGTLTIHSNCSIEGSGSFRSTKISNLIFNGSFVAAISSGSAFESCRQLQSVQLSSNTTLLPNSVFKNCFSLTHLVVPATVTSIGNSILYNCSACQYIKLLSTTPPTLAASAFNGATTLPIVVPHDAIDDYWGATNYQSNSGNTFIGFKTFTEGDALPSTTVTGFSLKWYSSILDANASINQITTASHTAEYYARYTVDGALK